MNFIKRKQKNRNNISILIILIIIALLTIYFKGLAGYNDLKNKILTQKETIIEINKGDNFYSLAEKFKLNSTLFKIYLKLNPIKKSTLQAGKYKIEADTTLNTLFKQLKTPINETDIILTILEGWNIYDIDNYLTNKGLLKQGDFIQSIEEYIKDMNLISQFSFLDLDNTITLEGFLYPDTYYINPNNFLGTTLINKMLHNFNKKVYQKILKDKKIKEISNIINLSSIVEKEEKNNTEKPKVAGILKKRLENKWMIGADITVCYPHKLTGEECKMVISKYIEEKSPYNTRTMVGLPKTPIGNPSFETINAVINSEKTPYWYYLHDTKTGKIYYGKTNAEHEENKRNYLR